MVPLFGMFGLFVMPTEIRRTGLNLPSFSFCICQRGESHLSFPLSIFSKAFSEYIADTAMPSFVTQMLSILPTACGLLLEGESSGWPM